MSIKEKARLKLAKMLRIEFSEAKTDTIVLLYDGELQVGSEVFTYDEAGELTIPADGEYSYEDAIIVIVGGYVAEIKVEAEDEVEVETEEEFEEVEKEEVNELEDRVAVLEEQVATLAEILKEITGVVDEVQEDVEEVAEEFSKAVRKPSKKALQGKGKFSKEKKTLTERFFQ